ncbi:MAG: hypothetical protein DMG97_36965 [Acidobacteria bacterium]|nr:MAG: hypothetical protein DMG97_36965 [Acidobacteriota bacterium]PYV80334.1 MAG: hypothetical protein DMG96_01375 [Acidobacteriota bacterium]
MAAITLASKEKASVPAYVGSSVGVFKLGSLQFRNTLKAVEGDSGFGTRSICKNTSEERALESAGCATSRIMAPNAGDIVKLNVLPVPSATG